MINWTDICIVIVSCAGVFSLLGFIFIILAIKAGKDADKAFENAMKRMKHG